MGTHWPISLMCRVFAMIRETGVQSQVELNQRLQKMVLDTSLLKTQHYKAHIKSKVD